MCYPHNSNNLFDNKMDKGGITGNRVFIYTGYLNMRKVRTPNEQGTI